MTDERDPEFSEPVSQRISQAYRELGAEEPPRALDDAILAAARRSARPWTQRWAVPLSLAAVIVLSVTVTLRIQHEQPGIEVPAPQAAAPPAAETPSPAAEAQLRSAAREAAKEVATPAAADEVKVARRKTAEQSAPSVAAAPAAAEPKPFASDQAAASMSARSDESRGAASSVTGKLARQVEERQAPMVQATPPPPAAMPAPASAAAPRAAMKPAPLRERPAELTPEQELERIANLRRQERHDEADKALAEFRKRYPDYRIPEPMRERVERR